MFSLFILLRTSLKTTFVKELLFLKNKYKRGARLHRQLIMSGPRFYAAGDFGFRCCCVFSLDHPWKGDPKTRNGGMTEPRKITPNPKTRNGGKSPQILERGMAENPKTQNGGKSPPILKRETAENHP